MDLDNILYELVELIERTNGLLDGHFSDAKKDIQEYATKAAKPILDALKDYKKEQINMADFRERVRQTRSSAKMNSLKAAGVSEKDVKSFLDAYLEQLARILTGTVGAK